MSAVARSVRFAKVELSASSKTCVESWALEQKKGFTSHLGVKIAGACPGVIEGFAWVVSAAEEGYLRALALIWALAAGISRGEGDKPSPACGGNASVESNGCCWGVFKGKKAHRLMALPHRLSEWFGLEGPTPVAVSRDICD